MTEDDTFRVLTRIPFLEAKDIYSKMFIEWLETGNANFSHPDRVNELLKHGWTWEEFNKKS